MEKALYAELEKIHIEQTGKLPDVKKYAAGKEIYSEGQVPKGIYYVKKGTVKISHNNEEKPIVVRLVRAHEFMGYVSLIKRWDYSTTATALESSEICFIPKEFFITTIEKNIKFAHMVLDILCSHINKSNRVLADVLTKSVQKRLAILLLLLDHSPTDGKATFMKKDIASVLNIKAETLSRNLLQLQKQKLIRLYPKLNSIEILSREKLLKLTQITD